MSVLGWFLAVGGVAGVVFALRMMLKMKKMQSVPFRTPSEIERGGAGVADAKGLVSTEGEAALSGEPLIAPMSGEPCLAYQIVVERKWEKEEQTENGTSKKSGSDKVLTQYRGAKFRISDGAGKIDVDASKEPDAEFAKAHESTIKVGTLVPGSLSFGKLQVNTPSLPRDSRTTAFVGTEKIIKPGNLYALGALQGGAITTPPGMLGKLVLSTKGRAKLLAHTKRNMILGYAIGGVLAVGGTGLGVFGPKPAPGNPCVSFSSTIACKDKIYSSDGSNLTWTVPKDGTYRLTLKQPKVKRPIDGTLTITDAAGKQVAYNDGGSPGANAEIEQTFVAGTYKINVRDFARSKVSGGYSYALDVTLVDAPAQPLAAAVGGGGAAPEESETCQKAAECCEAISKGSTACASLHNATEDSCALSLASFRKAAKHNKHARIACQ
jgi:hypothetical protein